MHFQAASASMYHHSLSNLESEKAEEKLRNITNTGDHPSVERMGVMLYRSFDILCRLHSVLDFCDLLNPIILTSPRSYTKT